MPQKFKLDAPLSEMLDMKLETKPHIVMGIWNYIKHNKLQDAEDKRIIRCDQRMQEVNNKRKRVFIIIIVFILTRLDEYIAFQRSTSPFFTHT